MGRSHPSRAQRRASRREFRDTGVGAPLTAPQGPRDGLVVTALDPPCHLLLAVSGPCGMTGPGESAAWQHLSSCARCPFLLTLVGGGTRPPVRAPATRANMELPVLGTLRVAQRSASPVAALIHAIMQRTRLAGCRARAQSGTRR